MLRLSNAFYDRSVLSLRTGGKIGNASGPVINPNNLKIEGWFASDATQKGEFIVPAGEIRDFITKGLVVNDYDALTDPADLVRLKPIINAEFEVIGKGVFTEDKKKLGKVVDYAVDDGFYIQKLYVNPPLLKGLSGEQLLIARDEIIEITNKNIIVADTRIKSNSGAAVNARA